MAQKIKLISLSSVISDQLKKLNKYLIIVIIIIKFTFFSLSIATNLAADLSGASPCSLKTTVETGWSDMPTFKSTSRISTTMHPCSLR